MDNYLKRIKQATTKEELQKISSDACKNESNKVWDKVIHNCIVRELELGINPYQDRILKENNGKIPAYRK